jgi:hypothetical protein
MPEGNQCGHVTFVICSAQVAIADNQPFENLT